MTVRIGTKDVAESQTLSASAASSIDSTGTTAIRFPPAGAYVFVLDVTVAASAADDTLDVFIQTLVGAEWLDVIHFTQVLGNGGALTYVAKVAASTALTEYETGTALGAAAIRNICGDQWRARWDNVTGAGTHVFTFSIVGVPM